MSEERLEAASVEVTRWGPYVWVTIRSENSVGKAIRLSLEDASDLAARITTAATSHKRMVRDEPQA